jgi:drug/metabolite transporter (DMT)-like permease
MHFINSLPMKNILITLLALIAFAANSILCRMALATVGQNSEVDAAIFTLIRLVSGAVMLFVLLKLFTKNNTGLNAFKLKRSFKLWLAPLMLLTYAVFFSFAYIQLNTATGALILFAAVQLFLIGYEIAQGKQLKPLEWLGIVLAFSGFVGLMLPSDSQPSLLGFVLMLIAGIAWGVYTLLGKGSVKPLLDTTFNFVWSSFIAIVLALIIVVLDQLEILSLLSNDVLNNDVLNNDVLNNDVLNNAVLNDQMSNWSEQLALEPYNIALAVASGALASGVGYAIWYRALAGLTLTQAALSQLSVPLIAAIGGALLLNETLDFSFWLAAIAILSGIGLVSWVKGKSAVDDATH